MASSLHLGASSALNMVEGKPFLGLKLPFSTCSLTARSMPPCNLGVRAATAIASKVSKTSTRLDLLVQLRSFTTQFYHGFAFAVARAQSSCFTVLKPLGDRVLVKIQTLDEKTTGGILLPSTAQNKPQGGEVIAVGEGRTLGDKKIEVALQSGKNIVYSKYAGTEIEFNGVSHMLLKEDDIVGILETDDIQDLQPLNDRVLIKVTEAEEKTIGGVLLTDSAKEKPVIGTIKAVGPGSYGEDGARKPLELTVGSSVMYSKYAGSDFKSKDGIQYIVVKVADVLAVLS